jgi:hypothetical protein
MTPSFVEDRAATDTNVQSTRVPIGAHCGSTAAEQKLGAQNELNGISL